jgi:hypothetical protein
MGWTLAFLKKLHLSMLFCILMSWKEANAIKHVICIELKGNFYMTTKLKVKTKEKQFKDALYWGGAFLWAGLVFGADLLGLLPQVGDVDAWSWVFLGVGLYGLLGSLFFLLSPNWSNPTALDYIWSGFWLLVGLSGFIFFDIFWAAALILVGVVILVIAFTNRS